MTSATLTPGPDREKQPPGWAEVWEQIPDKGLFLVLAGAWVVLFQFLGNSTLGYVNTPSLFSWLRWMYRNSPGDEHGWLVPFLVLALFWWRREELLAVPKRHWWPGLTLVVLGLLLQLFSFLIQQTQFSVVAFFIGLYGLMGLVWGPKFMVESFFPFFLFAFCLPIAN